MLGFCLFVLTLSVSAITYRCMSTERNVDGLIIMESIVDDSAVLNLERKNFSSPSIMGQKNLL